MVVFLRPYQYNFTRAKMVSWNGRWNAVDGMVMFYRPCQYYYKHAKMPITESFGSRLVVEKLNNRLWSS